MTDDVNNPYAAPRPPSHHQAGPWGMSAAPLEYRCRKFVRWMQYVMIPITALPLIGAVAYGFTVAPFQNPAFFYYSASLLLLLLFIGGGIWWTWWSYHGLASTSVVLEDNGLVYRCRGREIRVPLDANMFLEPRATSFDIRSGDRRIRLPDLEGLGRFVHSLKAALDSRGLSSAYDRDRLFNFFVRAAFADQSWQRAEAVLARLLLVTVASGAVGWILAQLLGGDLVWTVVCIGVSALWPACIGAGGELVLYFHFRRAADRAAFTCPARDPALEHKVFVWATAIGVTAYVVIAATLSLALLGGTIKDSLTATPGSDMECSQPSTGG